MNDLFIILTEPVFLCQLPFEELNKLRFQEDLMQSDQDLNDHQEDLTQGIDKPDSIFDFEILSDFLLPMQFNQVLQFIVDNVELISDELLEHENVLILVYVVQTVHIWT